MRRLLMAVVASSTLIASGCGGGGSAAPVAGTPGPAPAPAPTPPVFTLSATVGGTAVSGFSISNGATGILSVQTGQPLVIASSGDVDWSSTLNGTDLVAGPTSATVWNGTFGTVAPRTVTLTATARSDSTKTASVTINVAAGASYSPGTPTVGASATYNVADLLLDGETLLSSYTDTTTLLNPDGSYEISRSRGGPVSRIMSFTAAGHRTKQHFPPLGVTCTYTPPRVYIDFPLHFGKRWTSAWEYACDNGGRERAALSGQVVALERITVPAGTFDAIKVVVRIDLTEATDPSLVNGEYRLDSTCWYGTSPVRFLGCDDTYTYTGTPSPTQLKTSSYRRATP